MDVRVLAPRASLALTSPHPPRPRLQEAAANEAARLQERLDGEGAKQEELKAQLAGVEKEVCVYVCMCVWALVLRGSCRACGGTCGRVGRGFILIPSQPRPSTHATQPPLPPTTKKPRTKTDRQGAQGAGGEGGARVPGGQGQGPSIYSSVRIYLSELSLGVLIVGGRAVDALRAHRECVGVLTPHAPPLPNAQTGGRAAAGDEGEGRAQGPTLRQAGCVAYSPIPIKLT